MTKRFAFLPTLLLLISAQASYLVAQNSAGIDGAMMTARGGQPDHAVRVRLMARGSEVAMSFTDRSGKFAFGRIPAGIYHIVIDDDKYRPIDETVEVDPAISDPTIVRLTLVPKDTDTGSSTPGQNPNMAGAVELKEFPKPAMKEYEKGIKAAKDGKADEAITHYQKAIEIAPDLYLARNNLGTMYLSQSKFEEARQQFEQVIKINPSDGAAYFNLGNLYLLSQKYLEASDWIHQGLTREPNNPLGHFLLGVLCTQLGNGGQAETELRKAIELDPKTPRPHLALINLYLRQRRTAECAEELRRFLKDFPNQPDGLKAQDALQKLEAQTAKKQNP